MSRFLCNDLIVQTTMRHFEILHESIRQREERKRSKAGKAAPKKRGRKSSVKPVAAPSEEGGEVEEPQSAEKEDVEMSNDGEGDADGGDVSEGEGFDMEDVEEVEAFDGEFGDIDGEANQGGEEIVQEPVEIVQVEPLPVDDSSQEEKREEHAEHPENEPTLSFGKE